VLPRLDGTALVKIDAQGTELLVLEGMTGLMPQVDMFLIEVSFIATLEGGAEAWDVIRFLKEHGFVLYDVLGVNRRPLDRCLAQCDLVFVPEGSFLRRDRRWAGDE
jgi:hypothetical protein